MPRKRIKVKKGFPRRKNKELPTKHKPRKAEKSKLLEQGFQKAIYAAATESEAEFNLELFAEKWDKQYPSISKSWRSHWANIIRFFAFPTEIRRAIYTTKAIESMNSSLRKVIKSQQIFPSDEAAFKLVYLAMRTISKKWTMPIRDWKPALNRFAILFEDRLHI